MHHRRLVMAILLTAVTSAQALESMSDEEVERRAREWQRMTENFTPQQAEEYRQYEEEVAETGRGILQRIHEGTEAMRQLQAMPMPGDGKKEQPPENEVSDDSPYLRLRSGSGFPVLLQGTLAWEQDGPVEAVVNCDVSDEAGQLLMPQGSRLHGEYFSRDRYDYRRMLVCWRRVVLPGGLELELRPAEDMPGDVFPDDAEGRWRYAFATAVMISGVTVSDVQQEWTAGVQLAALVMRDVVFAAPYNRLLQP